jgi:hypothetical protein
VRPAPSAGPFCLYHREATMPAKCVTSAGLGLGALTRADARLLEGDAR